MALFNKTKFDDITIENNAKYQPQAAKPSNPNPAASTSRSNAPTPPPATSNAAPRPSTPVNSAGYGIQEAIELIRKLPNVNTEMVITVVIKTLESANISVDKIVKDAQARENKIEDRSSRLIAKIETLEAEIAELNEEITQLNTDLEETNRVKELLNRALGIDISSTPTPKAQPTVSEKPKEDVPAE